MQGRISGFFMTLVMALPLAAIPLMSIFGIPQFGSLASTIDADTGFLSEDPTSTTNLDTAPAFNAAQISDQAGKRSGSMIVPVSNNLASGHHLHESSGIHSSQTQNSLTWEQAVEQLAQYGINNYRLQPGITAKSFHFACYLPGNSADPNHNHATHATIIRFEAEAANPLQAVQKTLLQIEQWHQ